MDVVYGLRPKAKGKCDCDHSRPAATIRPPRSLQQWASLEMDHTRGDDPCLVQLGPMWAVLAKTDHGRTSLSHTVQVPDVTLVQVVALVLPVRSKRFRIKGLHAENNLDSPRRWPIRSKNQLTTICKYLITINTSSLVFKVVVLCANTRAWC